jgi:hypothetical protein
MYEDNQPHLASQINSRETLSSMNGKRLRERCASLDERLSAEVI